MIEVQEEKFEVETPLGPIWFWGQDTGKPVLLVIAGTFSNFDVLDRLSLVLTGVDVWRAHLPGNHCPTLAATSVGVYAAAFSHALNARLANRGVVVVGLSVGGLVAMGLRAPNVKRLLVVEPPVLTEGLWMLELIRDQAPPGSEDFLWNVLGISRDRIEPRDYTGLLDALSLPTVAMIGEEPVGAPRSFTIQPSMITEAARAALEACGPIQLVSAPGAGHNVPKLAVQLFLDTLGGTLREALGPSVGFKPE